MIDIRKSLLHLVTVLTAIIGYIPAAIYAYIYSEFFTKYTCIYAEPPTNKSDSGTNRNKMSNMCLTSAQLQEDPFPLSLTSSLRPGF